MMMSRYPKLPVFLACAAVAVAIAWGPARELFLHGRPRDYYSHIPLIPVISAYVLFSRRERLFREATRSPLPGLLLAVPGLALWAAGILREAGPVDQAGLALGGAILVLAGTFTSLYGLKSLRRASFPFLFLVFMVPLPIPWMEQVVAALVAGSTGVTHFLLKAFGVPFVQEGAIFRLPGFDLEVAEQCSGIRSSLALLITSVLAAQIFLRGPVRKLMLAVAVFPVSIFKNGVRIVALYLLSYFIDMRIIDGGFLHKSGGFLFFGLGLVVLLLVLLALRDSPGILPKR
jgi:exosortase